MTNALNNLTTPTLLRGNSVLQTRTEVLTPVDPYTLYNEIKCNERLKQEVNRLRQVATLDQQAYTKLKTRLPYFCCAEYKNGIRITEDFVQIHYFVLDIDKLPSKAILQQHIERLKEDTRVLMLFVSPGGKGIKLLFKLQQPIVSLKAFTDFYKTFCYQLAEQYDLGAYIDTATCDATRVCFLGYDPEAHYFALAEEINPIDYQSPMLESVELELFASMPALQESTHTLVNTQPESTYQEIRKLLNPSAKPAVPKQRQVHIPVILQSLVEPIQKLADLCGLEIREILDIHYGKKVVMAKGFKFAEVNVYYGKQGFTVYKTPKQGSDEQLADLVKELIERVIYADYN